MTVEVDHLRTGTVEASLRGVTAALDTHCSAIGGIESSLSVADYTGDIAGFAATVSDAVGNIRELIGHHSSLVRAADTGHISISEADFRQRRISELTNVGMANVGTRSRETPCFYVHSSVASGGLPLPGYEPYEPPPGTPTIQQGTPPAVDYGGAQSATFEQRIDPVEGYGIIKIAFFIADERAGVAGVPALESHGDYRGWDPDADASSSRATVFIDFEQGVVRGLISPSCGTGGPPDDCHSALPISTSGGWLSDNAEFLPGVTDTNRVEIFQQGTTVSIQLAIKNSDKRTFAPRINANLDVTPIQNSDFAVENRVLNVQVERDPFPMMEMYRQDANGEWITVVQDPSGGQAGGSLWPVAPNHDFELVSLSPR